MDTQDSRKTSLEDLSKDELVKKCRNLIALAQKAKVSKETLQEENNNLRKQLIEQQPTTVHNDATGELLEKLTNEKLSLVNQIEDLQLKSKDLESYIKTLESKCNLYLESRESLETENTSYIRQIKRLTDENEQLISDMSSLEAQITELHKLGTQQKEQLLELEKSNRDSLQDLQSKLVVSLDEVKKLNHSLSIKEKEITELSQELQAAKIITKSSITNSKDSDNHIKEINELKLKNENITQQLNQVESTNDKLKEKVCLYHAKLKKFALTTKQIKKEKIEVIELFKSYIIQIGSWNNQLQTASQQLIKAVQSLERENMLLKDEVKMQNSLFAQERMALQESLKASEIEIAELRSKSSEKSIQEVVQSHQTEIEKLKNIIHEINKELSLKVNIIEDNTKNITCLEEERNILNDSCLQYQQELEKIKQQLMEKDEESCRVSEALLLSRDEINKLNAAAKKSVDIEKRLADLSSEEIISLAESNKALEINVALLQEKLDFLQGREHVDNAVQTTEEGIDASADENGIDLKRENAELLLEMNQMNQALKQRGEIISQMEAHCEEIKKKLQVYESQANRNVDSISEKEETIRVLQSELQMIKQQSEYSKDTEIANLKLEVTKLKEAAQNNMDTSYAESETMSTSTISRSEESNRLKDLEGSWEERYGKLRTLAIKLKAKIRDQGNVINQKEQENEILLKKQSANLKTIQSLQAQLDKQQDDIELVKAENKQYLSKLNSVAENISKDKQMLVENEETISKLRKEIDVLINEKQAIDSWKKEVGAKVKTLRKELEAKNLLLKDAENKVSKVEREVEAKATQLKIEEENHMQTKSLLEQCSTESKRNSVLNLEMQDYERSVKELTCKIEKQNGEISNLQTQLDLQKNTVIALREQNKVLEERIQEEEKNGNSTNIEISAYKKNLSALEDVVQQKENKILDITKLLESVRSENEELSTELSKVISEHQKSFNLLRSERDELRNKLLGIQQNLRDTQDVLKLREDELEVIRGDYESYKVRAKSVLKKNQNRDLGLEEKLSEEVSSCRSDLAALKEELKDVSEKLHTEQAHSEKLIAENNRLTKKSTEVEAEVEELKGYADQLGLKHQKAINEQAETIRNLKVHADTLSQCYRQQLAEQEVRHNREIIELQSRIDKAPSPETPLVHPSMPREEGEGSESVESNAALANVHPIPLERLLDSKSDDEVVRLKKTLAEQESKVTHLTALLSDTEQDLAKHVQMNKVLKEEIRRQQRSVEREKHAENLEYLKNVVFKFITLHSGDERTRMVPVLNTILKLSPEETQKLTLVARGDPGMKGWTSYLPLWSPTKPQ